MISKPIETEKAQGATPTNLSRFVNVPRLNTHLTPFGIDDTRTIGTDKSGLRLALECIDDLYYATNIRFTNKIRQVAQ